MANKGFVYFLVTTDGKFVKVGRTENLSKRINRLAIQLPFPVTLRHFIRTNDTVWLESYIHAEMDEFRANGEWFDLVAVDCLIERWEKLNYWDWELQCKRERECNSRINEIQQKYYTLRPVTASVYGDLMGEICDTYWEAGL